MLCRGVRRTYQTLVEDSSLLDELAHSGLGLFVFGQGGQRPLAGLFVVRHMWRVGLCGCEIVRIDRLSGVDAMRVVFLMRKLHGEDCCDGLVVEVYGMR